MGKFSSASQNSETNISNMSTINGIAYSFKCAFVFGIFDLDDRKMLTLAECDALLRMVADTDHSDPIHLKHIESFCSDEGIITLANFEEAVSSQPMLIGHLLVVQRNLWSLLGENFSLLNSNVVDNQSITTS